MVDDSVTLPRHRPDLAAVELVAPALVAAFIVALMLSVSGPSESKEMKYWILSFAVAIPAGLWLGGRQRAALQGAAPAAALRALAAIAVLFGGALLLRHGGVAGERRYSLLGLVAFAVAMRAPWIAAARWSDAGDDRTGAAAAVLWVTGTLTALLYLPASAHSAHALEWAALFVAIILLGPVALRSRALSRRWLLVADAVVLVVLLLIVASFPNLQTQVGYTGVYHQGYFLGPANEVLHGHGMLDGAWSQYGIGLIDALALAFKVVPLGYGGIFLICVGVTCLQYVAVMLTLRRAGLGLLLTTGALAVAVLGNLFLAEGWPGEFPSVTALRFGIPYVLILVAVDGARRRPERREPVWGELVVVAVAAAWSFETWAYTAGTWALIVIAATLAEDTPGPLVRIVRRGLWGLGASAAGVALFSLGTWLLSGGVDWGPYLEYLKLYTSGGLGALPIPFFSTGPVMAAAIFLSTVGVVWTSAQHPTTLPVPIRTALAGFTGFAVTSFTYYVGRSHPNNLLNLLVPTVALGALWVHVLLAQPRRPWRLATAAGILTLGGLIAGVSMPSAKDKWKDTAFAQAIPFADGSSAGHGQSIRHSIKRLWDQPTLDPRAPAGVQLLNRYVPGHGPALVLTDPDLQTEILLRGRRVNLLPMSHAEEDGLIDDGVDRNLAAAERIRPGTLMLTSVPPPPGTTSAIGGPTTWLPIQLQVLAVLQRRFHFSVVARSTDGLKVVRLEPRS